MSQLTPAQVSLVSQYEQYSLDDLYALVGNQAIEYGDAATRERYIVGLPNAGVRGRAIIKDVVRVVCASREIAERFIVAEQDAIEPVIWIGDIAEIVAQLHLTNGIPPLTIAVTLAKLSNYTLKKLCGSASEG
jgi:hypothetical protein